jgi:GAF domain-containing protein
MLKLMDGLPDLCLPFVSGLPVTGVSISVFNRSGTQSSVCSSDRLAARIDELQFELGEGPQWETVRTGARVLIPDVTGDFHSAWPMFGAAILGLDVGALFTVPLVMGAVTVGVVGMYRTTAGELSGRDLAAAAAMAAATAGPAVHRAVATAGDEVAPESAIAPAMRREVHQATGMILVQLETTATIAYSRLRAYAFANGRTVQDVAHDVVSRQLSFRSLPD